MKDEPKDEQLFVLMDANARTGMKENVGMGSRDSTILCAPATEMPSTTTDNG